MSGRLQRLGEKIDAMSLRERGMLLAIVILLVWALWQALLMSPLDARRKAHAQQIGDLRTQITALNASVQTLAVEAGRDPQAEARTRLATLQVQLDAVDREVSEATSGLVAPQDMARVLEAILGEQRGLRLHALRSIAPEPIDSGNASGVPPLYRHGMTIEVDGDYLRLLQFVQAIEQLPWQFIWRELVIERLGDGQGNRMRLTLYTLSLSEEWLGV